MKHWFSSKASKGGNILDKLQKDIKSKIPQIQMPKNLNLDQLPKVNLKYIKDLADQVVKSFHQPSGSKPTPGQVASSGPMKFPYTFSAKLAQFPYKFYFQNNWVWRYYPIGIVACLPIFWCISKMANSKENKEAWKAIRQHEKEEYLHKFD